MSAVNFDMTTVRDLETGEPFGRIPSNGDEFLIDECGYKAGIRDGIIIPPIIKARPVIEQTKNWKLESSDIVIATYPKCGTTWLQQIVLLLLANGDATQVSDPFTQSPWIEVQMTLGAGPHEPSVGNRRVYKTHACHHQVPWSSAAAGAKTIVVARNPYDAAVSLYHHSKDGPGFKYNGDWNHFVTKLFLRNLVEFGCYWAWQGAWYAATKTDKDKLWVTFEELKASPAETIAKIANFLEIPLTEEVLGKVVVASGFDYMKQQFSENNALREKEGRFVKKNHIRQGASGKWKETFTVKQYEEFSQVHAERSAKYGLPSDLFDIHVNLP
eukprot:TRINITY_DN1522_c0_g3_i1.p1 TRINITY_DN1522_c0_g3~~TRINITY_DN1522_c0_g3_i1.p1  ORF type:complete len:347 (+),score=48.74 TRINITY_DN1522_c0_g3_i1:58-1041(+)